MKLPLTLSSEVSFLEPTYPMFAIPTQLVGQLMAEDRQGGAEAAGEAVREGSAWHQNQRPS